MNYWDECIEAALAEVGIKASAEQIKIIAGYVEGEHENYGMAFGHDALSNPLESRLEEAERKLEIERSKVMCSDCSGKGWIRTHMPGIGRSSESECRRCRGDGRHSLC
jgi:hypothetical protein